jgi:hypothetical protein
MVLPFPSLLGFPDYSFFGGFAKEKCEMEEIHLI